MDMN